MRVHHQIKDVDERIISNNLEITEPQNRVDPKYILRIVEQDHGHRVQQIHSPTYRRPYPNYIDMMYLYPINFKFPDFCK
jgi:hypothetical protein